MEWPISEVARLAGTTSRTLRHYGDVGLVHPSRVGSNGYRYYDQAALERLQRVLLLRQMGLGIPAIVGVLEGQASDESALVAHLEWLRGDHERLARQIASVENTIHNLKEGNQLMPEDMFDGFDHSQHRDEIEKRWGAQAYAESSQWWQSLSASERAEWMSRHKQLAAEWSEAAARSLDPAGPEAQKLARRHVEWLAGVPGTPGNGAGLRAEYIAGLGELYVADDRFGRHYGGAEGAAFVRDALAEFAKTLEPTHPLS